MFRLPKMWLLCACLLLGNVTTATADEVEDAQQALLQLHENGKLYDKAQHREVRAAFAKLFEKKHGQAIRKALDSDADALLAWLNERPDFRDTFFTAIDERYDKIPQVFTLFRDLWKQFPTQLEKYPQLGIAVAVTWDDPRGVYDYAHHQVRAKSKMPSGLLDGLGNFQYLVENEKATEGRCKHMPWEFLVYVVDHRTPVEERKWAQKYYQTVGGRKSWHQDVPYDHDMLKAEKTKASTLEPRLKDEEYTLANIRKLGGVCAHQADFAARVAKSVGMPAAFVWGESSYRGLHAWWQFVQIQKANPTQLQFTLGSDGRTVGFIKDAFYIGNVVNPRTGKSILDSNLDRHLQLAGNDRNDRRQVEWLLRIYPWLQEKMRWSVKDRVAFLDKCLRLCPQSDEVWLEFAKLVKGELQADQKKVVQSHLTSALTHFKNYPDFLWKMYADMLVVFEPAEQLKLYQQAVTLFERAGRPDLACDARLKITDVLGEQKKWQVAADGLTLTINRFPTEGRYVPKLTLKMQEVCAQLKGGNDRVGKLYLDLVPKLVAYYKEEESTFSEQLAKQALDYFEKNQMTKYTTELKTRLGSK